MGNIGFGFLLMGIGMVTVFIILLIVIYGSQGLISLLNRIAPEEQAPSKAVPAVQEVPSDVKAVLEAAVAQITGGKGRIIKITR